MATRTLIIGDSYGVRRPLYLYELVDDLGEPFVLSDCTVRTTYKASAMAPADDPNDESAIIKHHITFNSSGVVTSSNGLFLDGPYTDGKLIERLSADESKLLTAGVLLSSDLELTDHSLTPDEVFTWLFTDKIVGALAFTNRESDV